MAPLRKTAYIRYWWYGLSFESEHALEKRINLASPCVRSLVLGRSIDSGPYPFGLEIFTRSFLSVDEE